jgi:hypothetical protein
LTSALFVGGVGIYQLPYLGWRVSALAICSILIGVVPFFYYRWLLLSLALPRAFSCR